jgi:hypothetical protein
MGYNTDFILTVSPNADHASILAFINKIRTSDVTIDNIKYKKDPDFCYPIGKELETKYYGKWYESYEEMKILSKAFPDVLFTLKGSGEDDGDLWINEYFCGNVTEHRAVFIIPPRNVDKSLANLCIATMVKNPSIINPKIPADIWEKLILEITRNNFSKMCVDI